MKGTFISVWDNAIIRTPAELDTETGELSTNSVDAEGLEHLIEELFEDEEGNEHNVCPDCHEYILKEKDITDTDENGNELPEIAGIIICSNPYCTNS